MINSDEYLQIRDWLKSREKPMLVTHRRADGDALGSLAALGIYLKAQGKLPIVTVFDDFPPQYELLSKYVDWRPWSGVNPSAECVDGLVIVDTCSFSQLEPIREYLADAPPVLVIDHHLTADDIGTRDGDLRIFDTSASAVCTILADFFHAISFDMSQELATALLVGVGTDTGWFRYSNTDARTMRIGADLLATGIDNNRIYRAIYETEPPQKLALTARLLNQMDLLADGKLAVIKLRQSDFDATGADQTMTEDLVNAPSRLAGLEATVMFTDLNDGVIRVNFRSKEILDVSELAKSFGGGGHARAAGARVAGRWDDVVPKVIEATLEALGS